MKKLIIFLLLLLPGALYARDVERAERVYRFLLEAKGDSVLAESTAEIQTALPVSQLNLLMTGLTFQFGMIKEAGKWSETADGELRTFSRRLTFERAPLVLNVAFTSEGKVGGLSVTPAPAEASPAVETAEIKEEEVVLTSQGLELPATLTFPRERNGKLPAVVFVHGSGPNDRDETLGPNKLFRDLAHALARQGVASLRYDKRTKVYGMRTREVSGGRLTYDEETVDDAAAALGFLSRRGEFDTSRLFVIGHSLGGMLAPRVALRSSVPPAGLIMIAAPARPFWEMLRDQILYISLAEGRTDEAAEKAARELEAKVRQSCPTEYLEMIDWYQPVRTACRLGTLPMLFLQGGADYQVTEEDLKLWKDGLTANPNATFRLLPTADHQMRSLPRKAVPADYMKPLPIMEDATDAIVQFITLTK